MGERTNSHPMVDLRIILTFALGHLSFLWVVLLENRNTKIIWIPPLEP